MRRRILMAISNSGAVEATYGEGASLAGIARSLEPLIREHAQALEERRIPQALVEALYDAGVFRAMLPREVGGLEAEPVEWLQMVEELTRINASAGWGRRDSPRVVTRTAVRLREANVFAVRSSKEAVGLIFEMAGSSAVYRGRVIEQAFRDISTAANHTNYVDTAYTAIGSYFLTRDREGGPEIAGRPFF
jgi:alkylation response protein AidB-like acyl-CoA dehydrogenase